MDVPRPSRQLCHHNEGNCPLLLSHSDASSAMLRIVEVNSTRDPLPRFGSFNFLRSVLPLGIRECFQRVQQAIYYELLKCIPRLNIPFELNFLQRIKSLSTRGFRKVCRWGLPLNPKQQHPVSTLPLLPLPQRANS